MLIPEKLLEQYSPIIKSWKIERNEENSKGDVLKLSISFVDDSNLKTFEAIFFDSLNERYGYHWMSDRNETLYRWDNTPHFPVFSTFPYHRHVGELEIAESFDKVSLEDVLLFIANQLS